MVASALLSGVLIGVVQGPAAAAVTSVTAVKGSACGYYADVGISGAAQTRRGCGQTNPPGDARSASPSVTLPPDGRSTFLTQADPDGAIAVFDSVVVFGGEKPADVASVPPSGPLTVKTKGTPAGGTVTSGVDIVNFASAHPAQCAGDPAGTSNCTVPGGFGPSPVEGDELHVTCTASATAVSATTTFVNGLLTTSTDADGNPLDTELIPNQPAPNDTRVGLISNVGDSFAVVFNQQIVNPDGSLTVNAVHLYLFGPRAYGEVVMGQAVCGTTPAPPPPADTVPPTCGLPVVVPMSPEDLTPATPYTELIGVFDAGGLQSIDNVQATDATVSVGPGPYPFTPGQSAPLQVTATRTDDAEAANLPIVWSFDARDSAGNVAHCQGVERPPVSESGGAFHPLAPARILDTRVGIGGINVPVGPGATIDVPVTGQGGVPAAGVSAVAMNVTVTQPTAAGFLTLFPTGGARPNASNLNFTAGETIPNLVVVKVGTEGKVALFNYVGSTHVIFDVAGWYADTAGGADGRYQPLPPARILDTRVGPGAGLTLGPGASLDLQVTGQGGVPPSGAEAAVLNVAVTNTTATSFMTISPTGQPRPNASNLNWTGGDTVSNRVMIRLGTGGRVTLFNNAGSADVIVDVGGWYTDASQAVTGGGYTALAPARILDSRVGIGGFSSPVPSGGTVDVQVTGQGGVPATGVAAVILNATVTQGAGSGFLTIYPTGSPRPNASDLNYGAGETRPNLVVVRLGDGGKVSLFAQTGTDVIFDVAGWFS